MWGAFTRQIFAYLLTRRGKRALAFVGMLSLGFVTALLADMQLYISSAFTGCLSAVLVTMWLVQYWRVKQHDRARKIQRLAAVAKRLAAAQERTDRYDRAKERAKSTVTDTVRAAGTVVHAGTVGVARSGVAAARSGLQAGADAVKFGIDAGTKAARAGSASARSGIAAATSQVSSRVARATDGLRHWRGKTDGEPV